MYMCTPVCVCARMCVCRLHHENIEERCMFIYARMANTARR